jgi:hypothetical protein
MNADKLLRVDGGPDIDRDGHSRLSRLVLIAIGTNRKMGTKNSSGSYRILNNLDLIFSKLEKEN